MAGEIGCKTEFTSTYFRGSRLVVPSSLNLRLEQEVPPFHWLERDSIYRLDLKPIIQYPGVSYHSVLELLTLDRTLPPSPLLKHDTDCPLCPIKTYKNKGEFFLRGYGVEKVKATLVTLRRKKNFGEPMMSHLTQDIIVGMRIIKRKEKGKKRISPSSPSPFFERGVQKRKNSSSSSSSSPRRFPHPMVLSSYFSIAPLHSPSFSSIV
uniref:Uncharacterized protein n=1 Tax=Cucumis melo TaxID=3656 RepID=A0A9I9EE07_CUCME